MKVQHPVVLAAFFLLWKQRFSSSPQSKQFHRTRKPQSARTTSPGSNRFRKPLSLVISLSDTRSPQQWDRKDITPVGKTNDNLDTTMLLIIGECLCPSFQCYWPFNENFTAVYYTECISAIVKAAGGDVLTSFVDGHTVEDWFNTYHGYLQYVSRCTNVWFVLVHVDVIMGYMTYFRLATGCVQYSGYDRESSQQRREQLCLPRETLLSWSRVSQTERIVKR